MGTLLFLCAEEEVRVRKSLLLSVLFILFYFSSKRMYRGKSGQARSACQYNYRGHCIPKSTSGQNVVTIPKIS